MKIHVDVKMPRVAVCEIDVGGRFESEWLKVIRDHLQRAQAVLKENGFEVYFPIIERDDIDVRTVTTVMNFDVYCRLKDREGDVTW